EDELDLGTRRRGHVAQPPELLAHREKVSALHERDIHDHVELTGAILQQQLGLLRLHGSARHAVRKSDHRTYTYACSLEHPRCLRDEIGNQTDSGCLIEAGDLYGLPEIFLLGDRSEEGVIEELGDA